MGSGWVVIGAVLWGDSDACAIFDYLHEILCALDFGLWKAHNVDVVFGVLPELMVELPCMEDIFLVEEVVEFSTVDFIERNPGLDFGVVFNFLENITGR